MSRHRLCVVAVAALAFGWAGPSYGLKIRFAQITDAHLLDADKKRDKPSDSLPENERALRWAIDEINHRNARGPAYEFVVFTGDLGLEPLVEGRLTRMLAEKDGDVETFGEDLAAVLNASGDRDLEAALNRAVNRFRAFLDKSHVGRWIMVPGNNDLVGENPASIKVFHAFVKRLQQAVGTTRTIVDFAPDGNTPARLTLGNCRFFGLDDSSFKSNNSRTDRDRFEGRQLECVRRLQRNVEDSATAANAKGDGSKFHAYIFCHIADIDDPNNVLGKTSVAELIKKKGGEQDPTIQAWPRSAWTVSKGVRDVWDEILKRGDVKRVFAGHFHSSKREVYEDPKRWLSGPESRYPDASFAKLLVCPPLAVKFQLDAGAGARGFRDVTIDQESGDVTSEIKWLEPNSELHGTPPPKGWLPAWQWWCIGVLAAVALVRVLWAFLKG